MYGCNLRDGDIVAFGESAVFVSLTNGLGFDAHQTWLSNTFTVKRGGWTDQNTYPRHVVDMNGDGKADIIGFGQGAVFASLASWAGFGKDQVLFSKDLTVGKGGWTNQNKYPRLVADVTGNGMGDLVGFGEKEVFIVTSESH